MKKIILQLLHFSFLLLLSNNSIAQNIFNAVPIEVVNSFKNHSISSSSSKESSDVSHRVTSNDFTSGTSELATLPLQTRHITATSQVPFIVVNMATSDNSTLPSFSTAVAALPYSYFGATSIEYRFSIKNNQTNVTLEIVSSTRFVTIPLALRDYYTSYEIKASAVIDGEIAPYLGNTITVFSPTVVMAQLSEASCNTTLSYINGTISSNAMLNALNYTFRIRLTNDVGPTPIYGYSTPSSSRFLSMNSFVGFPVQYSTSYAVAVQYEYIDVITGLPNLSGYGEECTVTTPNMPLIRLASPNCGSIVSRLGVTISALPVSGVLQYEFRIRETSDNGAMPMYYYSIPNTSRFSSLSSFQGITISYVTQYSISVRYKVLFQGSEVWSEYGPECTITTPVFPVTEVQPDQCGIETATLNQNFNIVVYPGFPMYRVTLSEQVGENLVLIGVIYRNVPNFKLNMFTGVVLNKTYGISISILLNNIYGPEGKSCDIATFAPAVARLSDLSFSVVSYPNPFSDAFSFKKENMSNSKVRIKVCDLIGKLIEAQEVSPAEIEFISIGANYLSGIYNVVISQDEQTKVLRMIKR